MPVLRLPLFWFYFRNLGVNYAKTITNLINQDYVNLVFHSWGFANIKNIGIPFYVKRNTGPKMEAMLNNYILWCLKKGFKAKTIKQFLF